MGVRSSPASPPSTGSKDPAGLRRHYREARRIYLADGNAAEPAIASIRDVGVRVMVPGALDNFPFTTIDPATVLDESEKWEKIWSAFFLKK